MAGKREEEGEEREGVEEEQSDVERENGPRQHVHDSLG